MLMEIEKSKKPFVAAIMGSCLGGGLEVDIITFFNTSHYDIYTHQIFECFEIVIGSHGLPLSHCSQRQKDNAWSS